MSVLFKIVKFINFFEGTNKKFETTNPIFSQKNATFTLRLLRCKPRSSRTENQNWYSLMSMNSALCVPNDTNVEHFYWVLFANLSSGWATINGLLLAPIGNSRKMSFPRNTTHCEFGNRTGIQLPFDNFSTTCTIATIKLVLMFCFERMVNFISFDVDRCYSKLRTYWVIHSCDLVTGSVI